MHEGFPYIGPTCAAYWGYMSNILKIIVVVFELGQPEYFIDLQMED